MTRNIDDMTDEDWKILCDSAKAERDKRAAERDAIILANAEKWSSEVVCAVTGKPLPHDAWLGRHDGQSVPNVLEAPCRAGGDAIVLYCGYGSKHDGSMILLGISDEALDALLASGRARVIGEYM